MIRIFLAFWQSEPQYAYKRYACKKNVFRDKDETLRFLDSRWIEEIISSQLGVEFVGSRVTADECLSIFTYTALEDN